MTRPLQAESYQAHLCEKRVASGLGLALHNGVRSLDHAVAADSSRNEARPKRECVMRDSRFLGRYPIRALRSARSCQNVVNRSNKSKYDIAQLMKLVSILPAGRNMLQG
jgi:hypothetical protein